MGQSSIRVTLDLYGHLFPDADRGVLESLDALTALPMPHRTKHAEDHAERKSPCEQVFRET